jgi:hypothetical protein
MAGMLSLKVRYPPNTYTSLSVSRAVMVYFPIKGGRVNKNLWQQQFNPYTQGCIGAGRETQRKKLKEPSIAEVK